MIEFKTTRGKCELRMQGDMADFMTDTCVILSKIYDALNKRDKMVGECYKNFCKDILVDLAFKTDEEIEEETKELKGKRDAIIDDILSDLDKLANIIKEQKKGD